MNKRKIGIYGGTFSPPHLGHVGAAESFFNAMSLDELIIMPTFSPPHKQHDTEILPSDRIEMCKIAFGHIDKAVVSDLEIKRGGKSYTAITLKELSSHDRELYFLCGTDMFITLDKWYMFEKIFELAVICYVRREDEYGLGELIKEKREEYIQKYNAKIIEISNDVREISSSEIRDGIKNKTDLSGVIPRKVYDYITEKGLYR